MERKLFCNQVLWINILIDIIYSFNQKIVKFEHAENHVMVSANLNELDHWS